MTIFRCLDKGILEFFGPYGFSYVLFSGATNMKKFTAVKELIASLEADAEKFYNKGNSAAGTRVRKGMQDLKNLAQSIRLEVQEAKNKA